MSLYLEVIEHYLDEDGLVLPKKNTDGPNETGNNLYTWIWFYLLWKREEQKDKALIHSFQQLASSLFVSGYPGLMFKSPGKINDEQSHDDYIWLTAASQIIDNGHIAYKVWFHGHNHCSTWNNLNPKKFTFRSWFGRFPWFICHFYYCCFKEPGLFLSLAWYFRILCLGIFGSKSNTAWLLTYPMVVSRLSSGSIDKFIVNKWNKKMRSIYSDGFKGVLAEHLELDHPILKYWVD